MTSLEGTKPCTGAKHVDGDLLKATEQYIVHQCNCTSKSGRGIAKTIFQKWPHADVYSERVQNGVTHLLGTIVARGGTVGRRGVINLFGQHSPGKPRVAVGADSAASRLNAFENCLEEMKQIVGLESVAFPFQIGSGLAGGHWPSYEKAINKFAMSVHDFGISVSIYKLPVVFDRSKKEYVKTQNTNSSSSNTANSSTANSSSTKNSTTANSGSKTNSSANNYNNDNNNNKNNNNKNSTTTTTTTTNNNNNGVRKPKNPPDAANFFNPKKQKQGITSKADLS